MCDSDNLWQCNREDCFSNGFYWYTGRCWLDQNTYQINGFVEKSFFNSLPDELTVLREIAGHTFNTASFLQHDIHKLLQELNEKVGWVATNTDGLSGDTGGGDTGGGDTGSTTVDFTELIDYFKGLDFPSFMESGEMGNGAPDYTTDNDDSLHSYLRQVALYLKNISVAFGDSETVLGDSNVIKKLSEPTPRVGAGESPVSALMNEYMEGVDFDGNGLVFGKDFHIVGDGGNPPPRFIQAFTDDDGNPLTTGVAYTYRDLLMSKYIEPLREEYFTKEDKDGNGKVFSVDFNFSSGCPNQLASYNDSWNPNAISFNAYLQSVGAPAL